jgi:SUMO ligase MMS21 Smc5/6 complex component
MELCTITDKTCVHLLLLIKYGWTQKIMEKVDTQNTENDCKICYATISDLHVLTTKCQHTYHKDCILTYICKYENFQCPICSKPYTLQ